MGRIKGSHHEKARKYLNPEERGRLVARYQEAVAAGIFLTQAQLAAEFGMTQPAVSKALRLAGVKTRTYKEASPSTVPVLEAARVYLENPRLRLRDVAEMFDTTWAAIQHQFAKAGIPTRPSSAYPIYTCDRDFFAEVDPARAYFAGFIAADGYVTKTGRALCFGVHPKDECILRSLKEAAGLEQPIVVRPNNTGRLYSWLSVCSTQWVRDLERHYNIVNCKSLILKPPNLTDEKLVWHFIRGYFDGDGHASKNGDAVNFTCGSPYFFDWLIPLCGQPGHVRETMWLTEDKEAYVCAKAAWFSGEVAASVTRRMYEGSTPATRLDRKYSRLLRHLPGASGAGEKGLPKTLATNPQQCGNGIG